MTVQANVQSWSLCQAQEIRLKAHRLLLSPPFLCPVFVAVSLSRLALCDHVWTSEFQKNASIFFPFVSLKPSFIFTSLLSSDLLSSFSFSCCSFAAAQLSYLSLEQGRRRRRSDSQTWESDTNTHQSAVLCRRGIRNSRRVDAATRRLIKALA